MMKRVGLAAHPPFISEKPEAPVAYCSRAAFRPPKTQNYRRRFVTCPNLYWK